MKKLEHELLTNKYTDVWHEDESEMKFNAPHHFCVVESGLGFGDSSETLAEIHFQSGPIKENGINGVTNEDLIAIVICRLEHFNQSEFRCIENTMAIAKLEEALLRLRKRTLDRELRGVEGTHEK